MELTLRRRGSYVYRCNLCGWQSSEWEPVGVIGPSCHHRCREDHRSMKTIAVQHWLEWEP